MSPEQLELALPCYVCGDLPPEVFERVRALVAADPQLAQRVAELSASRALCESLLRRPAPPELGGLRRGGVVPEPVPAPAVLLLVLVGWGAMISWIL